MAEKCIKYHLMTYDFFRVQKYSNITQRKTPPDLHSPLYKGDCNTEYDVVLEKAQL